MTEGHRDVTTNETSYTSEFVEPSAASQACPPSARQVVERHVQTQTNIRR